MLLFAQDDPARLDVLRGVDACPAAGATAELEAPPGPAVATKRAADDVLREAAVALRLVREDVIGAAVEALGGEEGAVLVEVDEKGAALAVHAEVEAQVSGGVDAHERALRQDA